MSDPVADSSQAQQAPSDRRDRWTTLLLAAAGLLSAWAAFQGGIWSGIETEHYHRANAALTRSSQLDLSASQREADNAALFVAWLGAVAERQQRRADYLADQFDPPFREAFRRWRATLPQDLLTYEGDGGRPAFAGLLDGPAQAARRESQAEMRAAANSGNTADRYDRWSVLLATALFLAGIASVNRHPRGQLILLGLATALTAISALAMLLLPVSFGG